VIINKPKSTAAAKPKEKTIQPAVETKKPEGQIKPEMPEAKREKPKLEPVKHPQKDLPMKEQPKPKKPLFGGIKQMFTKKPSSGK